MADFKPNEKDHGSQRRIQDEDVCGKKITVVTSTPRDDAGRKVRDAAEQEFPVDKGNQARAFTPQEEVLQNIQESNMDTSKNSEVFNLPRIVIPVPDEEEISIGGSTGMPETSTIDNTEINSLIEEVVELRKVIPKDLKQMYNLLLEAEQQYYNELLNEALSSSEETDSQALETATENLKAVRELEEKFKKHEKLMKILAQKRNCSVSKAISELV